MKNEVFTAMCFIEISKIQYKVNNELNKYNKMVNKLFWYRDIESKHKKSKCKYKQISKIRTYNNKYKNINK